MNKRGDTNPLWLIAAVVIIVIIIVMLVPGLSSSIFRLVGFSPSTNVDDRILTCTNYLSHQAISTSGSEINYNYCCEIINIKFADGSVMPLTCDLLFKETKVPEGATNWDICGARDMCKKIKCSNSAQFTSNLCANIDKTKKIYADGSIIPKDNVCCLVIKSGLSPTEVTNIKDYNTLVKDCTDTNGINPNTIPCLCKSEKTVMICDESNGPYCEAALGRADCDIESTMPPTP